MAEAFVKTFKRDYVYLNRLKKYNDAVGRASGQLEVAAGFEQVLCASARRRDETPSGYQRDDSSATESRWTARCESEGYGLDLAFAAT